MAEDAAESGTLKSVPLIFEQVFLTSSTVDINLRTSIRLLEVILLATYKSQSKAPLQEDAAT